MNRIVVVGKCLEFDDIGVDRQLAQYIVQFFRNAVDDDDRQNLSD